MTLVSKVYTSKAYLRHWNQRVCVFVLQAMCLWRCCCFCGTSTWLAWTRQASMMSTCLLSLPSTSCLSRRSCEGQNLWETITALDFCRATSFTLWCTLRHLKLTQQSIMTYRCTVVYFQTTDMRYRYTKDHGRNDTKNVSIKLHIDISWFVPTASSLGDSYEEWRPEATGASVPIWGQSTTAGPVTVYIMQKWDICFVKL